MISRMGNKNIFAAHYEWLALGVGIVALAVGAVFYVMSCGDDPEDAASVAVKNVEQLKPSENGVKVIDMGVMRNATRITRNPLTTTEVPEKKESFLASERRILCKCKKVIPGSAKECPFCHEKLEETRVVLDADGDGMADEWEKNHGLNPGNAADANEDLDGDEFTNLEEYLAKTDPKDKNDHPDYLDSLKIVLPLKETYMPFIFTGANKIPSGWRCAFFAPGQKDSSGYGRKGRKFSAIIGEEIADTGYILKTYEKKEAKQEIKGSKGLMKTVDVSEITVARKTDGKVMKLVQAPNFKAKPEPVDVQATLAYERGTVKNLDVVPGSEITLSGVKYRIVDVTAVGKGAKVTIANSLNGKKRVLEALEQ